jgi:acyl-CoA reductase-like NAD-dependent aldehyde dehydrogenase
MSAQIRQYGNPASPSQHSVHAPWDGVRVAQVGLDSHADLGARITGVHRAFSVFRSSSRYARAELLMGLSEAIAANAERFAGLICEEAGKPISAARVEVQRACSTFRWAAEELRHFAGELVALDGDASARAYSSAHVEWFPRGPVLAITPFNFPLNLVAHKVAPALAAGCPVLLKPAPQAPGAAYLLHELFLQVRSGLNSRLSSSALDQKDAIPEGAFEIFFAANDLVRVAVQDPRLPTLSFTGSDKVGWMLQTQAQRKKVCLELGGDGAVIVHSDADLDRAAERVAWGAFVYSGQVCISVQRVFVHESVREAFLEKLLASTRGLPVGDPADPMTVVGPVIDDTAASRIHHWISDACSKGAKVALKGAIRGRLMAPWILTDVPADCDISCNEVFGPVVSVEAYSDLNGAFESINSSRFGLQAGIFTVSLSVAENAYRYLEVGGLIVNDVPTYRADPMPYGGIKDSGLGREGLRSAMQEFSEQKVRVDWRCI